MSEYLKQRRDRARKLLAATGYDAVIATSMANLYYFTDQWIHAHERVLAVVIRKDGDDVIIAPEMHRQDFTDSPVETIFWQDGTDAIELLGRLLPDGGQVSVDDWWPSRNLIALQAAKPNLHCTDSRQTLSVLRRTKDAQEIAWLKQAGTITDRVMEQLMTYVKPGVTERALIDHLMGLWKQQPELSGTWAPIIGAGPNGAMPHHSSDDTRLRAGDMVVIDMGCTVRHYNSDITRTVVLGPPSARQQEVYETVLAAHRAAAQAARPGVMLGDVDGAARSVIEEAGYGSYFIHRTGHGLGIEIHEEPYVSGGNELALEDGMVFTIEPGIYLPEEFGVRIEDTVVMVNGVCESLNPLTKELQVL